MIKKVFKDKTGNICWRRVMGSFGFLCCCVAVFIPGIELEMYKDLIYVSGMLLGVTTIDLFSKG